MFILSLFLWDISYHFFTLKICAMLICVLYLGMNRTEMEKLQTAFLMALGQLDQLEAMLKQTEKELGIDPAV